VTSVLVTHDQEEALEVADRVVVMRGGRIEQAGTPEEVYHSPATPFVCRFLGHANFFHGRLHQGLLRLGDLSLPAPEHALVLDTPALACARPHEIELSTTASGLYAGRAVVRYVNAAGPVVRLELEIPGSAEPLLVECTRARRLELGLTEGSPVYFKLSNLRLFVGPAASLN
jgi:sulfate transport system ATP-binding protein